MAKVSLQNVTKVFDGDIRAVSGFTLDVADGEFMVIVGPSGCGKTTTLRIIAGLEPPDTGKIYIGDKLVNALRPSDRNVAMVFQNYALYPHMTIRQNLAFPLKVRPPRPTRAQVAARVEKAAGLLGIEAILDRRPGSLSGGQCQRAALGRAIVRDPDVFLLDEPLSNLDSPERLRMRTEVKRLFAGLGATCIFVTHDQAEAMSLGDRICVMRDGAVRQVGPPLEVYERPVNRFVAGFLGMPPMNFLAGRLQLDSSSATFITAGAALKLPPQFKAVLSGYNNSDVLLGVRPENISSAACSKPADNTIAATVELIEPVGSGKYVHLAARDGAGFIARFDPHTEIHVDQEVAVCLDIERIHIFELSAEGKNLTLTQ